MDTYDDAAYDRFRSELVNAGFSPVHDDDLPRWTGPIRASLRSLTDATRMQIRFYPGWPLRYAHVFVAGLKTEHDAQGTICLWAEDDPAQIDGRELNALWDRLDQWAAAARQGFAPVDRALDAYRLYVDQNTFAAELPLRELIDGGSDGYAAELFATVQGEALLIDHGNPPDPRTIGKAVLHGAFYLRADVDVPPRTFDDVRAALSRHQRRHLDRGLARRSAVSLNEPSGGHDFVVLAWPRHDDDHDAVVLGFAGTHDTLQASVMAPTSNDIASLRRRAGPDADLLADKTVLLAGVGSVGGHVAVAIASSGVGTLHLWDSDRLTSVNLVRHVCSRQHVGYKKTHAVGHVVTQHAPWCAVTHHDDLPYGPHELQAAIEGADLVIDCTGIFSITAALAETCRRSTVPLINGALYHHGALARVQRQADGDTLIAARQSDAKYLPLPAEDQSPATAGFLELGCTAPVNNAPPIAVLSIAADIACAAVDLLTDRCERPDERITVLRTMGPPFDRRGTLDPHLSVDV
ncbi:dinucleotide-utilizing protein [Mycobacterium dioxanotrophicus]|uniref:Dinucleotide-utilizing protein n=1 Tax=Mycobacterium dioxanotrophicus TaxID=482462 RepID=A0A1Y0BWL8_9MYCO|nr:ThiF family adenylyltransferase [Mycobacterium dioxanotrophicus]ART67299.1 dinucleotide-utilizing protein [Mycobacterium dioxanotrophicus]